MYEKYRKNADINKILDAINEVHKDILPSCHGQIHAQFVIDAAEQILRGAGCNERVVELGKIAALLHDVGVIAGRWRHAQKSAALAAVFLDVPGFSAEERRMIVQAIEDHSGGKNIQSEIGAALLIADKIDISRQRIFDTGNSIDSFHKNLREIEEVALQISEKAITINYITTENFSKDLLISAFQNEYKKGCKLPKKAAKFLGRKCRFEINSVEVKVPAN